MKPTLFVALEGPLLIPGKGESKFQPYTIAEYAKPFLSWAQENFHVRILTDDSPRAGFNVLHALGLANEHFPVQTFEVSKTENMSPHDDFYWVDSELIPGEVNWLAEHRRHDRFLHVNPMKGIAPEHKDALGNLLRNAKKRTA